MNFVNKIYDFEVTAPPGVWKKIEAALDESEMAHDFSSRLYAAEVIPPGSAWDKIANLLDKESRPPVRQKKRIAPLLRYASAAVLIGLLALGGMQLVKYNYGNKEVVKQEMQQPGKIDRPQVMNPTHDGEALNLAAAGIEALSQDDRNDAALEASKKTFAKLDPPQKSRIQEIASGYYFASSIGAENIPRIMPEDEINPGNLSSRYITLITPEGNIIRMSKKLSDMVCCVSGEDENKACQDQIKKWQEVITCSPACYSSGSFMDMLGIVDALQED